jgi:8-oxo-dGTP diphosphatase
MNEAHKTNGQNGNQRENPREVRLVVAGLLLRGDTVLICQRRPNQPMALQWEFPGGKVEPGETAEQALIRELNEELGITAEIGPRVTRILHTYRSGSAVDLQFFEVHKFEGELENRIFNTFQWTPLSQLPNYEFLVADRELVKDLAAGKFLNQ